ncbi:hypothetical protein CDAR_544811 [Caerostris darwini]|uniref:Uncharacterized protein n=1 Tax=Caerostris darwini TaxID=1538125 RepID=A0AAV4V6R6_9ARAC|nr:hypothetical protein CDAR_544811 [Caerostris darwini]
MSTRNKLGSKQKFLSSRQPHSALSHCRPTMTTPNAFVSQKPGKEFRNQIGSQNHRFRTLRSLLHSPRVHKEAAKSPNCLRRFFPYKTNLLFA